MAFRNVRQWLSAGGFIVFGIAVASVLQLFRSDSNCSHSPRGLNGSWMVTLPDPVSSRFSSTTLPLHAALERERALRDEVKALKDKLSGMLPPVRSPSLPPSLPSTESPNGSPSIRDTDKGDLSLPSVRSPTLPPSLPPSPPSTEDLSSQPPSATSSDSLKAAPCGCLSTSVLDAYTSSFAAAFDKSGLNAQNVAGKNCSEQEASLYAALLGEFIINQPMGPIQQSQPPPLEPLNCNMPGFQGRRAYPARVVDLMTFGYEVDTVEIRMSELEDVVDLFFILESELSHHFFRKRLFFQESKHRFQRFLHKTKYFVDTEKAVFEKLGADKLGANLRKRDWRMEGRMRSLVFEKYEEFFPLPRNNKTALQDLVFIHGDPDEIPNRNMVNHVRWCKPQKQSYAYKWKMTMYRGHLDLVNGGWDNGCIFSGVRAAENEKKPNCRGGGSAPFSTPSWRGAVGAHLSGVGNIFQMIMKEVSISEGGTFHTKCEEPYVEANKVRSVRNPFVCKGRREKALRMCCDDKGIKPTDPSKHYIPWFAAKNKAYFSHLFPRTCKASCPNGGSRRLFSSPAGDGEREEDNQRSSEASGDEAR